MRIQLLGLIGIFALAPALARADDACAGDRKSFCADAKGFKAVGACMKEHEAQLSDACKQQRAAVGAAHEELHKDCQADADKLCPGMKGKERFKCMKGHEADVSQPCKDAMAQAHNLREQIHPDCSPDVQKLCAGIEPGAGRIASCLQAHSADLSPGCQARLSKRAAHKAAKTGAPPATPPPAAQ